MFGKEGFTKILFPLHEKPNNNGSQIIFRNYKHWGTINVLLCSNYLRHKNIVTPPKRLIFVLKKIDMLVHIKNKTNSYFRTTNDLFLFLIWTFVYDLFHWHDSSVTPVWYELIKYRQEEGFSIATKQKQL